VSVADAVPGPVAGWLANAGARPDGAASATAAADPEPTRAHRLLPDYGPTALAELPDLAADLGLERIWVKDETTRLGLPSFKVLGASYAIWRALAARVPAIAAADSLAEWRTALNAAAARPELLVTATDGNHGRAVAYVARLLGLRAHVLVPADMAAARIAAIEGEGASVEVVDGTYDEAIERLAGYDGPEELVISDTSWEGYDDIPLWVIQGYGEISAQLAAAEAPEPDLVLVQAGVGALTAAAVLHWRAAAVAAPPLLVTVEPADADCVLAALRAGAPELVAGPHTSMLVGLNCGLVSSVAWPILRDGLDGAVTVDEDHARAAVRLLHGAGIPAGETGAAGLAGLVALKASGGEVWRELGLAGVRSVLTICTEGVTDPSLTAEILG
jgi:diaminopropionate ammonia-lyase